MGVRGRVLAADLCPRRPARGGVALLLIADPNRPADLDEVLECVDAVIAPGGSGDVDPALYGEVPHPETQADFAGRDAFEAVEDPGKPFLLGVRWHPEEDESATVVGALVAKLGQGGRLLLMRVNVGRAKTDLSKLLARVEAGEDVEIARDGVSVARLVRIDPDQRPGVRFLAARGSLAGQITIGDDFELSDAEIDEIEEMLDPPV